jgi:hypothetical protein
MKRSHIIGVIVAVVAVAAIYFYMRGRQEQVVEDLVAIFPDDTRAEKRSSLARDLAYKAGPETIKGETRPSIYMHPNSRLTFKRVTIPDSGHLRVYLGVKEDAWDKAGGDGVLFRFGVSDGRQYDELLNQHVDPLNNSADRQWIAQDIDLSAYAGQQVDLIFNTQDSPPRRPANPSHDFAIWGAPAVVVKH